MTLAALAPHEREVIRRAMEATFQFFDADFETRLGIPPAAMSRLLGDWPDLDDANDASDACLAINTAMNDLLHGVGIDDQRAKDLTGADRRDMLRIYRKWSKARC